MTDLSVPLFPAPDEFTAPKPPKYLARPEAPPAQDPPVRSRLEVEADTEFAKQQADFERTYQQAFDTDPEFEAEALRVAKELGGQVSPEFVRGNMEVARTMVQRKAESLADLRKTNPILFNQLYRTPILRVGHDDLHQLKQAETLWGEIRMSAGKGDAQNVLSWIGARQMFGVATPDEELQARDLEAYPGMGMAQGPLGHAAEFVGQQARTLPIILGAGAAAAGVTSAVSGPAAPVSGSAAFLYGSGTATFAVTGLLEAGAQYRELRKQGVDHEAAKAAALIAGGLNGALDAVSFKFVSAPFRAGVTKILAKELTRDLTRETARSAFTSFAKDYLLNGVGAGAGTETLQEVVNIATESYATGKSPQFGEIVSRLTEVASATAQGMAVLGLPGAVFNLRAEQRLAAESKQHVKFLERAQGMVDSAKTTERAPDLVERLLEATAEGTVATDIHINGNELGKVLSQLEQGPDDLDALMPGLGDQLRAAQQSGGDVVVPIGAYTTKIGNKELGLALKPHIRLSAESLSAQQIVEQAPEIESMQAEAKKAMEADSEVEKQALKIEQDFADQLTAANAGLSKQQVRDLARFHRDSVVAIATRNGLNPDDVAAVAVGRDGQADLSQSADSPEFKAWFGDSKVVDETGAPLVVHHGTSNYGFEVFETYGSQFGLFGTGSYFTADRGVAESYTEKGKGGRKGVYSVFLSIKNPFDMDAPADAAMWEREFPGSAEFREDGSTNEAWFRATLRMFADNQTPVSEAGDIIATTLQGLGYDGITHMGGGRVSDTKVRHRVFIAFEPTQIKSVNNRGTYNPNDPNILNAGGDRGAYDIAARRIILREGADVSTVAHELSHHYFQIMEGLVFSGQASETLQQDFNTLLDWFKVKDVATWQAMSQEARAPHLEAFAYNWEKWLSSGKAPTHALRRVFERLAKWIVAVYKGRTQARLQSIYEKNYGAPLPALSPEVEAVFGRMVAADDAIRQLAAERGQLEALGDLRQNMTDAEWKDYLALVEEQTDRAVSELTEQELRDAGWAANLRLRTEKEFNAKVNKARKDARPAVEAQVREQPVHKLREFIKTSTPPLRIQIAEGDPLRESLRGYVATKGEDPDVVAEMFGFTAGGRAMLEEMASTPPLREAVDAAVTAKLAAENSVLTDPKQRAAAVAVAVHNKVRERVLATELRALSKSERPVQNLVATAREVAKRILQGERVGQISVTRYAAAEAAAARRMRAALKKGDTTGAILASRQQLIQNQLVRLAADVVEEIEDAKKLAAKIDGSDKNLSATRNVDYVLAARAILSGIGLIKGQTLPLEYVAKIRDYDPTLYARLDPIIREATAGNTLQQYDAVKSGGMSLAQFRESVSAAEGLWELSRSDKKLEIGETTEDLEEVAGKLVERMAPLKVATGVGKRAEDRTARDRIAAAANSVKAKLRRVEAWAESLDGGEDGPFTRYLWRPVRDALNGYRVERNKVVQQYMDLVRRLDLKPGSIEAPLIGDRFANKATLLGAMLHTGNLSNLRKLLLGYKWGQMNGTELNRSSWDAQVNQWIEKGVLTEQDFQFLQATWDLMESLKPTLQRAHRKLFGTYFKEVEAEKFENKFGTFRGGYMPASADKELVPSANLQDQMEALAGDFRNVVPATPSGFVKERNEDAVRPLALDIRRVVGHLDQVVRFAHVQPAIKGALKLLNHEQFAARLAEVDPSAKQHMLLPFLARAARQTTQTAGMDAGMDRFLTTLRQRAGMVQMFFNVSNTLQQVTGFVLSATKVPVGLMGSSLMRYLGNRRGMTEQITKLSPFMADRLGRQMSELAQQLNDLVVDASAFNTVQKWGTRHAYVLQSKAQNVVDIVTWQAAYDHYLSRADKTTEAGIVERDAVAHADAVVRLTQSSLAPEDLAAYEAGTPFFRLFTQFTGYFNTMLNLNATEFAKIIRQFGWVGAPGKLTTAAMLGFIVPVVLADAIATALAGQPFDDDDDDDDYLPDVVSWAFGSIARGSLALLPFGPNLAVPFNALNDKPYDDRILTTPSTSALERSTIGVVRGIYRLFDTGEVKGSGVRDVLSLITMITGVPVSLAGRPVGYVIDAPPEAEGLDYLRGLVTGSKGRTE